MNRAGDTTGVNYEFQRIRDLWGLDPSVTFLNHGSFGATPLAILEKRCRLLREIESEPVQHFAKDIDHLLAASRERLADFLGATPEGLVFVPNATTGVNTVLRSIDFRPGDEILVTDHIYNACNNAAEFVAQRAGAKVVTVHIPFPVKSPSEVVQRIEAGVTQNTRLALIDHVTSPTALVFPIEEIVGALNKRGVEVLVDGAHAPGMLPLSLNKLGASYYTGNCHKWLCAPKGAAFLYLRDDVRSKIRPLVISHGANSTRTDKSRLHLEFDWVGTSDYTPYLVLPDCIDFIESLYPGGAQDLMKRNHELALYALNLLCEEFSADVPCPPEMIGSMAAAPVLPLDEPHIVNGAVEDPVRDRLFKDYRIEVPIIRWPDAGKRLVRVSAQAYNSPNDYRKLVAAIREIVGGK